MAPTLRLIERDGPAFKGVTLTPAMFNLTIALMVLVLVACALTLGLYLIRRKRQHQIIEDDDDDAIEKQKMRRSSRCRSLTITTSPYSGKLQASHVYEEKKTLMENSSTPPQSPDSVPEIHITFPEEEDAAGHRKMGKVVIVRVGETGVGLEPLPEGPTPASPTSPTERFQSIDLDRIGGLKER
ncbi:MAG: mannose-ethanolamine phosphotransferase gpi13 [Watsoniomyces obsoletus]|nr:MAG: mannose-ethanolamine phosphotransferase gpi13 [Watsoniomyces obsoletus]